MNLNYGIDKNTIILAPESVKAGTKTFNTAKNLENAGLEK